MGHVLLDQQFDQSAQRVTNDNVLVQTERPDRVVRHLVFQDVARDDQMLDAQEGRDAPTALLDLAVDGALGERQEPVDIRGRRLGPLLGQHFRRDRENEEGHPRRQQGRHDARRQVQNQAGAKPAVWLGQFIGRRMVHRRHDRWDGQRGRLPRAAQEGLTTELQRLEALLRGFRHVRHSGPCRSTRRTSGSAESFARVGCASRTRGGTQRRTRRQSRRRPRC